MNVWKIGSRWDKDGDPNKSILDIFIKYNIVFADPNRAKSINSVKINDLIAVADGKTVVAVGVVLSESKNLNEYEFEGLKNDLKKKDVPYEDWIQGFKVELYRLEENEKFKYTRGTFHKSHGTYEIIITKLLNKRKNKTGINENKEYESYLAKYQTKDIFNKKEKILKTCIKQINIEDYQDIRKINISNIPIDTQWIFLTGENAKGKTSILRAILIALQGQEFAEEDELLEGSFIEFKTTKGDFINKIGSYFIKFTNFAKLAAYGAKRTDLSDRYISEIHENLFEKETALYDFERKYKDWKLFSDDNDTKIIFFEELLKLIVSNLSKIDIEKENSKVVYYELAETEIEIDDKTKKEYKPVYFNQLAMGMRSIIAMISDFIFRFTDGSFEFEINNKATNLSGIVLIDEFDNHLHPKWQKMLVEKLTKIFPKVQFIVSTHSPIPFLGAPKNSVFIKVDRTKEDGITAKKLDIDVSTLTPNSILTSPIFGFREIISSENKDLSKLRTEDDYDEVLFNQEVERRLKKFVNKNIID